MDEVFCNWQNYIVLLHSSNWEEPVLVYMPVQSDGTFCTDFELATPLCTEGIYGADTHLSTPCMYFYKQGVST